MIGNGIVLILEDENDKNMNIFNSTYSLEEYLTTINLNDYEYKNILFYVDGEMNMKISKIYKNRLILGRGAPVDPLRDPLKNKLKQKK